MMAAAIKNKLMSAAAAASVAGKDRFHSIRRALGASAFARLQAARVLVVGAGGIGCELLKNLVLSGFQHIDIIDLDTIDVSNLNRQFLFRRAHVGSSKARIAKDAVLAMMGGDAKNLKLTAAQANVKDEMYNAEYFREYTIVMNALDNLDARRHVNRLCLGAKVPLIESGTQGYLGQVTPIRHLTTECFECMPQPTPKTFAACTIRNTPDKPVHCIHWAKYLYSTLFGPKDDTGLLNDLRLDPTSYLAAHPEVGTPASSNAAATAPSSFGWAVFDKLFRAEIEQQLTVKERWANRIAPTPLAIAALRKNAPATLAIPLTASDENRVLSVGEQAVWFCRTVHSILTQRRASLGTLDFDKDDALAMDFVAAASNLRSANFGIPMESRFGAKGIAGNIVHAIATTNAMAAALIVQEAIKIINAKPETGKITWIRQSGDILLQPQALMPPNPKCYVCGSAPLSVSLNTETMTLSQFFSEVLKKGLGMNVPSVDNQSGNYIGTESEYEENPAFLKKTLKDVKIVNGSLLSVEDDSQELKCNLTITHTADLKEEEHPSGFILSGNKPLAVDEKAAKSDTKSSSSSAAAAGARASTMRDRSDSDSDLEALPDRPTKSSSSAGGAAAAAAAAVTDSKKSDAANHKRSAPAAAAKSAAAAASNSPQHKKQKRDALAPVPATATAAAATNGSGGGGRGGSAKKKGHAEAIEIDD